MVLRLLISINSNPLAAAAATAAAAAAVAVAASGVLVVVELRVVSARCLGAAIQEAGEWAGYESGLGE